MTQDEAIVDLLAGMQNHIRSVPHEGGHLVGFPFETEEVGREVLNEFLVTLRELVIAKPVLAAIFKGMQNGSKKETGEAEAGGGI